MDPIDPVKYYDCYTKNDPEYEAYLQGEVYGVIITKITKCMYCGNITNEECLDLCYGFYGSDFKKNGIYDFIKECGYELSTFEEI